MNSFRICALCRSGAWKAVSIVGVCLALFLVCSPLFSQGSAGRILGIITDQNRPHYRIALCSAGHGTRRSLSLSHGNAKCNQNRTTDTRDRGLVESLL